MASVREAGAVMRSIPVMVKSIYVYPLKMLKVVWALVKPVKVAPTVSVVYVCLMAKETFVPSLVPKIKTVQFAQNVLDFPTEEVLA